MLAALDRLGRATWAWSTRFVAWVVSVEEEEEDDDDNEEAVFVRVELSEASEGV